MMIDHSISRRAFLAAGIAGIAGIAAGAPAAYPDQFHTDGGLVILPSTGTLYVASDFHTRHADFQRWLERTDIIARLKNEQDTYALILGDAVDEKFNDPQAEKDGDTRIVNRIRQIQAELGPAGKKLIFILGNHEQVCMEVYDALKKQYNMTPATQARLVNALYASGQGGFYRQFNFLERMNDEHLAWFRTLPVAVLGKSGLAFVHAGPSRSAASLADLTAMKPEVLQELLWTRPEEILPDGHTAAELVAFLKLMNEASLLICGHTPLGSLPQNWIREGLGIFARQQVILATSYGSIADDKRYLVLDLGRNYRLAGDLRAGSEIHHLREEAALGAPRRPAIAVLARNHPGAGASRGVAGLAANRPAAGSR
jgi:hypothetical protein